MSVNCAAHSQQKQTAATQMLCAQPRHCQNISTQQISTTAQPITGAAQTQYSSTMRQTKQQKVNPSLYNSLSQSPKERKKGLTSIRKPNTENKTPRKKRFAKTPVPNARVLQQHTVCLSVVSSVVTSNEGLRYTETNEAADSSRGRRRACLHFRVDGDEGKHV